MVAGPGAWTSAGPDGGWAAPVQVDLSNPARIFFSTYGGFFRSNDDGAGFQRIENGLSRNSAGRIPFAVDRQQPQRVWAAASTGAFVVSSDRGDTWVASG